MSLYFVPVSGFVKTYSFSNSVLYFFSSTLVSVCDDCTYTKKHNHEWTNLHKGYSLNFPVAKSASFDIGYLQEKFRIDENEAIYMAKILNKNFGLKFRDLNDD